VIHSCLAERDKGGPRQVVYTFRDGLIATLGNYLDPLQAEHAAGLEPDLA